MHRSVGLAIPDCVKIALRLVYNGARTVEAKASEVGESSLLRLEKPDTGSTRERSRAPRARAPDLRLADIDAANTDSHEEVTR